jgi:2,4-dichlorophenol 6-monooxygenase
MEAGGAFGLRPDASAEVNWAQFKRIWSDKPEDAEHRREALRAIRRISMEANELNVEYGYRYRSAAVIPDGSPEPEPIDDIRLYEPSTRPGSPLPHAWIDDESGHCRPLKDLVVPGRFLLIAGEDGQDWCAAAATLAAANDLPIDAVRIGHIDGDLFDPRLAWAPVPRHYHKRSRSGAARPGRLLAQRRSCGKSGCDIGRSAWDNTGPQTAHPVTNTKPRTIDRKAIEP